MQTAVALSGGIDSAIAARRVLEQGDAAVGIFLRHPYQPTLSAADSARWVQDLPDEPPTVVSLSPDGKLQTITWNETMFAIPTDAARAAQIARHYGMKIFLFDAEKDFAPVVDGFIADYFDGRTPNPCVFCNATVKFGAMVRAATQLGCERFATGHYVSVTRHDVWLAAMATIPAPLPEWLRNQPGDRLGLVASASEKDQSYLLWRLEKNLLPRLSFPIGRMTKSDVRQIAATENFPLVFDSESQDLCFIPNGNPTDFLRLHGGKRATAGEFVGLDGRPLGSHTGYEQFTVGQRKGLCIGFGERTFVQRIEAATGRVVLGPQHALAQREIFGNNANWLVDVPFGEAFRCTVKVRYRSRPVSAMVTAKPDGTVQARLDEPCHGVAPGQSLVCYVENRLLGGAVFA